MTGQLPGARTVTVSGFRGAYANVDPERFRSAMSSIGRAFESMIPAVVRLGEEMDSLRYRMLVTNLMRARTFEEATAIVKLRDARRIRNGARRHRAVKHARDELRAARKQADRTYP